MQSNPWGFFLTLSTILLLVDLYTFKGVMLLTQPLAGTSARAIVHGIFWLVTVGLISAIGLMVWQAQSATGPTDYKPFFMLFGIGIMFFVPKLLFSAFHLVEDLSWLATRGVSALTKSSDTAGGEPMTRFAFLTKTGAVLAAVPFISIGYGILKGRYDFRVLSETLHFPNLPAAFDGLKVVQLSDIHIGSFFDNHKAVQRGIDMVNSLEADVIFFTGDLVNNYANELEGWIPVLGQLKAKMGIWSIMGNHDYGDYVRWDSEEDHRTNIKQLHTYHKELGFQLMLNENTTLEKDGEQISLIGIENWGAGGFAKYGDLKKAAEGTENAPFKILLSHDPSHWDHQVLNQTDIDLTLSGHTHGMQFGVEIAGIKWSPVKWRYSRWGGLYREGKQHLYVNRGFGYIGFPGRVGIWPEITLLELKRA